MTCSYRSLLDGKTAIIENVVKSMSHRKKCCSENRPNGDCSH